MAREEAATAVPMVALGVAEQVTWAVQGVPVDIPAAVPQACGQAAPILAAAVAPTMRAPTSPAP